jgi:hypothetical protein
MTSLTWILPHPHEEILRHILNMVNTFLRSSINYLENRLLPNNLIIVRNNEDDDEDVWDIKNDLDSPRDVHKVEIQTNPEFQSLIRVQLRVQDHLSLNLTHDMHTTFDLDVLHMHGKRMR